MRKEELAVLWQQRRNMERFILEIEKYKIVFPNNGVGLINENEVHYLVPPSVIAKMYRKGLVKKDYAFNRHKVWSEKDKQKWADGTAGGYNITPFYLIDIESSLKNAIENNDEYNISYFQRLTNDGFEFITCVGGNRGEATLELYDEGVITDEDNQHIHIIISENATLQHACLVYGYEASGVAPNRQEYRNGKWGAAARLVREIATKWRAKVFPHFLDGAFNTTRMLDDRQVAGWVYMVSVSLSSKNKKNIFTCVKEDLLDDMYEDDNSINEDAVNKVDDFVCKWFEVFNKLQNEGKLPAKKLTQGNLYSIAGLYYCLKEKKLDVINFDDLVLWYMSWVEQEKMSTNDLYKKGKKNLNFSELLAGTNYPDQVKFLRQYIDKNAISKLKKKSIIGSTRNLFTKKAIQEYWSFLSEKTEDGLDVIKIRQNGETKEGGVFDSSLEEYKNVTIQEFQNRQKIVADHVVPIRPCEKAIKGGETNIYNLEFTTKEYNDWKTNHTPLYDAPIPENYICAE